MQEHILWGTTPKEQGKARGGRSGQEELLWADRSLHVPCPPASPGDSAQRSLKGRIEAEPRKKGGVGGRCFTFCFSPSNSILISDKLN